MNAKRDRHTSKRSKRKISSERISSPSFTLRKKLLFAVISVGLFFSLLEIILYAVGVKPLLANKDPYVGFSSQIPLLVERQVGNQTMIETAPNKLRWFNAQQFPKLKASGTYRIFSVGGSTTFGRPYDDRTSFSGWLRELLAEAVPDRHWEVINAGGISYASYRVVRVMRELAKYEPDLFIVYTGHNEFLEDRTYREVRQLPAVLQNVGAWLGHSRVYAVMDSLIHRPNEGQPSNDRSATKSAGELEQEVHTRLDGGVGPDAYARDDLLQSQVLKHFRFNLEQMVHIARECGSEIVLITPAANLADCSPFKSEHEANLADLSTWQQHYDDAEQALDQQQFEAARTAIEQALAKDPRHAHSHYLHGQILQHLGLEGLAKQAFVRARDEDVCALRALSPIVQIVREVAADEQVPLIDYVRLIDEQSPGRIPGSSLFLDHVHPTIEGNRLLALSLFDFLNERQIVPRPEPWDATVDRVVQRVERGIDRAAHGQALRNLAKVLSWAGKQEEANRLALQASSMVGGDAETAYLAGNALLEAGNTDDAIKKFEEALKIDPNQVMSRNSLGSAYFRQGQLDAALQQYQRVVELQPDFSPAHNNLGALYEQQGETELAIRHYEEAIRLNPRYSKAYNNVAVLLRKQRRFDEAVSYLRKALAINPDFAEAYFNLGTISDEQGDTTAAVEHYRRAVKLNPQYGPAYHRLGIHLQEQRQWRAAAQAFRQAIRPPTPSLDAARRLAWILATCPDPNLRNGRLALEMAQGCVKATQQRDPEALSTLAAAYAEAGDFDNAIQWQTAALQIAAPTDRAQHQLRLETLRSRKPIRA